MNLETDRLVIKSLIESDTPAVLKVYQGSKDFFDLQTTEEPSSELIRSELAQAEKQGREFAGILRRASNDLIGVISFVSKNFQGQADYAWISLLLIRISDRRQGFGREAYQAIEQFIFSDPTVQRIGHALLPQFDPSLKFAEALGFERAGGPFKNKRGFGLYSFVKRRPDRQPTPGEQIWQEWQAKIEGAD
jgi:RimJ/RimL family protein N-acetyltransferase